MGTHQPIRKTVTPEIPDKLYFRIGDVARLCEVPTYVLRFWETEFPQLKPNKGGTGQRLYRKRDVELALRIKSLLYDQGYTIPGARQVFRNESAARSAEAAAPVEVATVPVPVKSAAADRREDNGILLRQQARLRDLREEIADLLASLSRPAEGAAPQAIPVEPKVRAMRPRLVLEPRPAAPKREDVDGRSGFGVAGGPVAAAWIRQNQRDLFGEEPGDAWPEPPAAS